MAVRYKFVHFNTRSGFDSYIPNPESNSANGNEYYNYVVFIKDTKEIYTHGQFYDCSKYDDSEIKTVLTDLEENKADKSDLDSLIAEIEENEFVIAKTLTELEESKSDKATTLAGYGITDAYTKTEINTSITSSKFITSGGTNSQVVLGDGTLKNLSDFGSTNLIYTTLANTGIVNAGCNYNNTYSGLIINTYTDFSMNTPDTVIVSTYPITFTGSCMKMDGLEDLSGTYYIYCLSYMANGMVAINGANYN